MADERTWELYIPRELIVPLLTKRGFRRVLGLTRLVNALRFAQSALAPVKGMDTPAAKRQRINSFYLTAALLVEGMDLARRLAQDYRDLPVFRAGLGALLRDREVEALLKKRLKQARNEAVFHVDDEIAGPADGEPADDLVFMSGVGRKNGDIYYDLGDLAAARVLFGDVPPEISTRDHMGDTMKRITSLAMKFLTGSDRLIGHVAKAEGLKMRLAPSTAV